ncbi:hypothetical protein EV643_106394 [Kribbella sp. VKM Ac-2527]|uniref:DUF4263 domain-containing protein n=1 Tax=Kribbella caucasensis TaxID=2512215 RepID=A0A4R6KFN9_9ACTN|nr:hypothetical protein [Kribbella sp. VKM Ac-2527]TDO49422.1 hypothetical protein EV643_106394 [Kribbella sp. VKM Ac-2527]
MKPTEFVKVNSQFWGDHLRGVSEHLPTSHARELPGPLLYPRLMVLTETPDWNILELVGVSREYRSLEVRRQKAASIDQYFGGGESAAAGPVVVLPNESAFKDATITSERGRSVLGTRFPGAQSLIGNELVGTGDAGTGKLLKFAPGNYTSFDRVLLVHEANSSVRIHWTFLAIAIHRSEPAEKYRDYLQSLVNTAPHLDPLGTLSVPRGEVEQVLKGDAFASTYLMHGIQDTTVGEFLNQHEDVLLSAFDATRLIHEPFLEWRDGAAHADEIAINPDFILERADGSHIIGDLRLPLLETANVTKGKKRRRSFTAPVPDGLAQLAHYEEYFQTPENRAFAKAKYGIEVSEPRKLLVIGSQENVDPTEFEQAAQSTTSFEIVDYDSILRLHLAAKS